MTTINSSKAYPITVGDKTASLHYHTIELINNSGVPVGSFTWWFGLYENIPDGWLVLDGSTFDQFTYPQLYRVLGSNVLPNVLNKNTGYLYGVPTFENKYIIPDYYQETIVNGIAYNVYNWTYPIYIILPEDELLDSFPKQNMNYFIRNNNGTYTKKVNTNIGAVYYRVKKDGQLVMYSISQLIHKMMKLVIYMHAIQIILIIDEKYQQFNIKQ